MRKFFLLSFTLIATAAIGQADKTFTVAGDSYGNFSALFTQGAENFTLTLDSKTQVELPVLQQPRADELLKLVQANPKALNSPQAILFVDHALGVWEKEKFMIGFEKHASGLGYKIETPGTGKTPESGKNVKVHYKGYLYDGTEFDNSFKRGDPIEFPLGQGRVIKGWDIGIPLFKVGGKGTLAIPPELGYGARGAGGLIPPNATLYFDIEVVGAD